MQSAYKRKAYSGYRKKTYKRPAYQAKSKFANARPSYQKGVVKATQELKQWGFTASWEDAIDVNDNLAGTCLSNAPNGNNGIFTQPNHDETALALCHGISQGSAANQRIGSKIMAQKLDLCFDIHYDYASANALSIAKVLQYAVIVDTQWSGSAVFTPAECFYGFDGTAGKMTPLYNNASRYKILKRGVINPTINPPMAVNGNNNVALQPRYVFTKSLNLRKMEIKYRAASAGSNTPADVQTNQIIIVLYDFQNPTVCNVYIDGTLTYYDA